ncbi:MAG: putative rane protein [Gemmatimonadetes bacterium]|nr:putative rane protein [Gemmatimonadota bacterium]
MTLPSLLSLGTDHSWNVSLVLLLLKATLILIAALGITLAMQRASAGARHLVWLVTLGALALIPALTAWGPLRLEILPALESVAATSTAPPVGGRLPATDATSPRDVSPAGPRATAMASDKTPSATDHASTGVLAAIRDASVWRLILAMWGLVALAIVVSLSWSALTVRRIVRRSRPLEEQSWVTPLWEVSDRLGLPDPPRLLLSHDAKMPFACGLMHPTIVLPAECESWSQDRRLAVLLHELAHVRRHDMVGHTLGRLVCAVYWFHPLVWTAARQLRSESERACDDLALACGTRATDYAEHLLEIVTSVRREGTPMVALAMARRKEFEGRMLAILDPELRHSTPSRRQSATLIVTLAVISIVVGAAAPAPKSARTSDASVKTTANASPTSPAASISAKPVSGAIAPLIVLERGETRLDTDRRLSMQVIESRSERQRTRASENTSDKVSERQKLGAVEQAVAATSNVKVDVGAALRSALGALGAQKHGATDDRPLLLAKVLRTDSSASLRRVAAWGLHDYAEQSVAAEALAAALRRDASEEVREMAAWSIGDGNEMPVAVEALRAALHSDASVAVRRTAAWALGNVGDEGAVSTLVAAFGDADATVRSRAIWAIGNIQPHQAPKPLLAMLSDKDARVRELTAWALYQIEDADAASALQAALRTETDKDLQLSYIRALAALGEKSVDALRGLLESSDPRIKSMAVHALAGGHASGPWPRPMPQPRPFP